MNYVPDKHENNFVEQFRNGNFFDCIKQMKDNKANEFTYKNINIKKGVIKNKGGVRNGRRKSA